MSFALYTGEMSAHILHSGIPSGYANQNQVQQSQPQVQKNRGWLRNAMVKLGLTPDVEAAKLSRINQLDRFAAKTPVDVQNVRGHSGLVEGRSNMSRPADQSLLAELNDIQCDLA